MQLNDEAGPLEPDDLMDLSWTGSHPTVCQGCGATIPPSRGGTPRKWCSDNCRKQALYSGACESCGATVPYNGHGHASRCAECRRRWTPERIVERIQAWADEHGGAPPTQLDWSRHKNSSPAQLAEYATGRWPSRGAIRKHFGSWNNGLLAAGFEPHRRVDRSPERQEAILAAVRSGEPPASIARRFGVTPEAIHQRMSVRGTTVRAERKRCDPTGAHSS